MSVTKEIHERPEVLEAHVVSHHLQKGSALLASPGALTRTHILK